MRLGKAVFIITMGMLMTTNVESDQSRPTMLREFPQTDDRNSSQRLDEGLSCQLTCSDISTTSSMECFEVPCMHRGILIRESSYQSWHDHQDSIALTKSWPYPMQLLEPRTESIHDCLIDFLFHPDSSIKKIRHWMGGSDLTAEGKWRWASDEKLFWIGDSCGRERDFSRWAIYEPNNRGDEDCMELYWKHWNDMKCSALFPAFYELA